MEQSEESFWWLCRPELVPLNDFRSGRCVKESIAVHGIPKLLLDDSFRVVEARLTRLYLVFLAIQCQKPRLVSLV
jgi:hypothetical protein